ncbi:MAG TPA: type II toxin-antitoxin system RelE/ParE family toxin [Gemmataceae bacterium]
MIIRPEAEADLAGAKQWYEGQKEGLGAEFLLRVEEVFERIARTPEVHSAVYHDVRRALTRRFPYAVYYRIEGSDVIVLAVFHTSRDPRHWQSRV